MQEEFQFTPQRRIRSVSDLVGEVKDALEDEFSDIWVQGEICDFTLARSGHCYFSLKDDESRLKAVCFRTRRRYLRFEPEAGMEVLARGSLSVYPPRGDFQLIVETMEPVGEGAHQIAFERLKRRLQSEGLFSPQQKKPLPLLPSKVGIVTSPTGAAIQDILRVLSRRNNRLDVLIYPASVQGPGASREIAAGVRHLNGRSDLDVLIVGRGGGSSEDLAAFNDEDLARAIFASRIPVISAVGHEIDFTIADFVADLRAPTPSAAAEIVSAPRQELSLRLDQLQRRALQSTKLLLQSRRRKLHLLAASRSFVDAETRLRFFLQRLDELQTRLGNAWPTIAKPARQRLEAHTESLQRNLRFVLSSHQQGLHSLQGRLEAYSPQAVLERGYAIVAKADSAVVRDPEELQTGERFTVRVARGAFAARKSEDDEV